MPVPYCGFDPCQTLTETEQRTLLFGIICTPDYSGGTDIDFEQLAGLCGHPPRSAKAMYNNARRKLLREFLNACDGGSFTDLLDYDSPGPDASASETPSADNGDEDDDQGQPQKKVRKTFRTWTPRKRKAGKEEDGEGGGPSGSSVSVAGA